MKKSIKSKTPAAPQVKKSTSPQGKTVGTKPVVKKTASAPAKPVAATKPVAAPKKVAVAKKPAAKPTAKKTEAKPVTVKSTPAKKAVADKAPAAKAPKQAASVKTVIKANIDVGFGNTLHLRGEGPNLSWDAGVPLNCASDNQWTIEIAGAKAPVVAKFLINDETWSEGENYVIAAGSAVELAPRF